jgi:alpha-amylase/alpha-mannosidase (GH57 family)
MTEPRRSVVIHGHFYQPPREDPWLDQVEREPTAAPWHDWNQRIERECYRAVVAARVPSADGRIGDVVNTLEWLSYDIGPTLLEWMEHEVPATYRAMLAADRVSAARNGGHGNAMAMPYHHVILPLASQRDKATEVRWGIADFRRRFGRDPAGLWLPEAAVDTATLDVLAAEGIAFTVLAPHQVVSAPPAGLPGRFPTSGGGSIALFTYDGALAHDVAFGPLIKDASAWAARLLEPPLPAHGPLLRAMATDGETYGHHHAFGEMALAATLRRLQRRRDVRIENFASFLARHPPTREVRLVEPSSWSCPHGVGRWKSDCGCRLVPETSQAWRGPLRAGLEWLAAELLAIYATEGPRYFTDPWAARDGYAAIGAPSDVPVRGRELLEVERNAMRMFTSCGWFFDDVAGIETLQVLKYAARAIDLAGPSAARLEAGLLERLAHARSNDPAAGTAADLYLKRVRPVWSGEERAAAGFAAVAQVNPDRARPAIGSFLVGARDDLVQTHHRRTGRVDRFIATAHRIGPLGLEVDLQRVGSDSRRTLGIDTLPERERQVVRETLRREVLRDVLSAEELVRLAHGSIRYEDALAGAVVRLVPASAADLSPSLATRLSRALDLLALEGQHVPFDAQTRFFHFMRAADPEARRGFEPLAPRLGFAREALGDSGGGG